MKIAWCTPFSDKSAIGFYSKLACEALNKRHQVTIYTACLPPYYSTDVKVFSIDNLFDFVQELDSFDYIIYNLGDNSNFHSKIYDISRQRKGIVILHDITMLNFFYGYFFVYKGEKELFKDFLLNTYGLEGYQEITAAMVDSDKWSKIDFIKYNCVRDIVKKSNGIIVHSNFHKEILQNQVGGIIAKINFPYLCSNMKKIKEEKQREDKIKILTVGRVNPNKMIKEVICAIGEDDFLKTQVIYTIAGGIHNQQYYEELINIIKEYKLDDLVKLEGEVSSDKLQMLYNEAHILINLRDPVIEGASWSLVEQMAQGKPIIVANVGFYSEMPDDCVIKINLSEREKIKNIQQGLKWIIDHPKEAKHKGAHAKEFLSKQFSPALYVDELEKFIDRLEFLKPIEELTNLVGCELKMLDINVGMKICDTVANEIENLFK